MFNFMQRSVLRDPDTTPGGNGATPPAGGPPNPGAVAFDPAAFESKFMDNLNKGINGIERRLEAKFQKMLQTSQPPAPIVAGDPPVDPDLLNSGAPKTPDQLRAKTLEIELNRMKAAQQASELNQKTLQETVQKAEAARMKAELNGIGAKALNGIKFADDAFADDAFNLLVPQCKYSEELGRWVGGDDVTDASKWIRESVMARKAWLAPVPTNPAGGRPGGLNGNGMSVTMDDLDPTRYQAATPARRAEIDAEMSRLAAGWMSGPVLPGR